MWYTGMWSPNGDQSGQCRSISMTLQWPLIMTSQWVMRSLEMCIVKSQWVMTLLGTSIVIPQWVMTLLCEQCITNLFYYVFSALCLIMILLWVVCNKKKQEQVHVWSIWVGEHNCCFCVGWFHSSFGLMKYSYTNTNHVFSSDWSNTHLFLL